MFIVKPMSELKANLVSKMEEIAKEVKVLEEKRVHVETCASDPRPRPTPPHPSCLAPGPAADLAHSPAHAQGLPEDSDRL